GARSSGPWKRGKPKPTQPGLAFVVRVQRPSKIELTPGVFGSAQLLVGCAEKVVSREVVGVHLQSPLEEFRGQPRVAFLELHFAEQNEGAAKVLIEPNGLLQGALRIIPLLEASVGVPQAPVDQPKDRTNLKLLVEFVERLRDVRLIQVNLPQKEMRHRDSGVQGESLLELRDGFV